MLSVVIPTYRKPGELEMTLRALVEPCRALAGDVEVVVVDDGSNDGHTRPVIEELARELPLVDAGSPDNLGRARARNRGWRAARGDVVLFLDDDIVLEPGALEAHRRAQRRRPGVHIGSVVTDPSVVDSSLFGYLDSRGVAKCAPGARVPARYFLTQNASVPKRALEAVGGFDESFGAYGFEDMEIAFRLEDQCQLEFFRLEGARGRHVHHHTLDDYLEKKRICGRSTLRRIAELHPQRLGEMNLDVLPSFGGRGNLTRWLEWSWRCHLPKAVRALVRRWPRQLGGPVLHRCYDYLVLSAYAEGLSDEPL